MRRPWALEREKEASAVPKVVIALVVVLVIAYVVAYPNQSADIVQSGWGHTKSIAHSLGDFVHQLRS